MLAYRTRDASRIEPSCPVLRSAAEYPPTEDGQHWLDGPWRWYVTCSTTPVAFLDCRFPLGLLRSEKTLTHQDTVAWLVSDIGLSRARIGELVGVSRQTVHRWQSGLQIQRPHWTRLASVSDVIRRARQRLGSSDRTKKWLDMPEGHAGRTPGEMLVAGDVDAVRALAMALGSDAPVSSPSFLEGFSNPDLGRLQEAPSGYFDEMAEERLLREGGLTGESDPPWGDD